MSYAQQMTFRLNSEIHPKGWGYEKWIVNNELYCEKLLFFNENKKCSFHFHKVKTETFYLQSGLIQVLHSLGDDIRQAEEVVLKPGDSFNVPVGLRHQMIALEESELFEFSTQHFEEDSYRIVKGD
jgi:mannose-6-phosphate isomerase-like protein (cupin superfamily)